MLILLKIVKNSDIESDRELEDFDVEKVKVLKTLKKV